MHIEFQSSKEDYIKYYGQWVWEEAKRDLVFTISWSVFAGNLIEYATGTYSLRGALAWSLSVVLVFIIINYLVPCLQWKRKLNSIRHNWMALEKLEVTDVGIHRSMDGNRQLYHWSSLRNLSDVSEYIGIEWFDRSVTVIPKQFFTSHADLVNLQGFIRSHMYRRVEDTSSKPSHWWGLLCVIPLIGAFVGFVLAINGISYKDKRLLLIGITGILFTIIVYWHLFWRPNPI